MDIVSTEKRSRIMMSIKGKDTTPELRLRRRLHELGFRFRLHRRDLPGKPDVVLPKYNSVVFVHGCFWHSHCCKIGSGNRKPKTNENYWNAKLLKNSQRDNDNIQALRRQGWHVVVVWECETKNQVVMDKRIRSIIDLRHLYERE